MHTTSAAQRTDFFAGLAETGGGEEDSGRMYVTEGPEEQMVNAS